MLNIASTINHCLTTNIVLFNCDFNAVRIIEIYPKAMKISRLQDLEAGGVIKLPCQGLPRLLHTLTSAIGGNETLW